jgi:acetoin utilization deacetylase AcuC-like enzyme
MALDSSRFPRVLVADDALFLAHVAPPEHPERGERLLAVRAGLERALGSLGPGFAFAPLSANDATEEQLARAHHPAYVEQLGHLAGRSGYLDADTYVSPGSVAAARRAAGAAVALVDALHAGAAPTGIALPRPPGHHALADRAMGFCLLNNIAVAAAHARAQGRERVLVLDWDVHHGNGTEAIFYADPSVLFVSLHQHPNYPGTGAATDFGEGQGRGRNVNLPLPPGATDAVYAAAFERVVLPIIEQFAPDFALVSCGFDAHARDQLAQMELSAQAYANMTTSVLGVLGQGCPLGLVLEGGYDLDALTDSAEAVAKALFGASALPAPVSPSLIPVGHDAALRNVEQKQSRFWRLP